ncbi:helix-turn-helix transcriptional regulator [Cytobacillus sp. FSL K6-0265]|uniref:helix-turn-helix transcriptional regulator n=1 Tax=Cytobacillus sp. FSL K6-0265 TaxID=2921448 RepID=UPI0030F67AB5
MDAKVFTALRKLNGLSQIEVAELLGVSRALIAIIETERQPISHRLEQRVKEVFGVQQISVIQLTLHAINNGSAKRVILHDAVL